MHGISTSPGRPIGSTTGFRSLQPAVLDHHAPGVQDIRALTSAKDEAVHLEYAPPLAEVYDDEARRQSLQYVVDARELELERERAHKWMVSGMNDEDLQALLRSFDKSVHRVRCPPQDLNAPLALQVHPSPNEEFSVEKLTSNLERFYSSIVVGLIRVFTEVRRIRNWEEGGRRSMIAMAIYMYAWWCNLVFTAIIAFVGLLVLLPSARRFCFDSPLYLDPAAASDVRTTAVDRARARQSPASSELKASEWAANVQDLMAAMAQPGNSKKAESVQEQITTSVDRRLSEQIERKQALGYGSDSEEDDMKKNKKDKSIQLYGQPIMRLVGGTADKWERLANALAPDPDWALEPRRLEIFLYLVAPELAACLFVSERMAYRGATFLLGILIFAQPLTSHILEELDRLIPRWKERLILENNILDMVPTNVQLMLRIMRRAEHDLRPLPPVPRPSGEASSTQTDDSSNQATGTKAKFVARAGRTMTNMSKSVRSRIRTLWDRAGDAKEEGFAKVTGRQHFYKTHEDDKLIIPDEVSKPSRFYVRHHKHGPGHLVIHPPAAQTPARIEFTTVHRTPADQNVSIEPAGAPEKGHLVVSIDDITQLRKVGMSLAGRLVVGWALDAEGAGGTGLDIKIRQRKHEQHPGAEKLISLTGIVRRDELFDRLLAIGDQRWEMF